MTLEAYSYLYQHKERFPSVQILGYYHRDLIHLFSTDDGIIMLNEKDVGCLLYTSDLIYSKISCCFALIFPCAIVVPP